jgi:hypothetical protein
MNFIFNFFKSTIGKKLWLALLIIFPIVLWFLPATYFDEGESICPSKRFFNIDCLGCGMTRAVMHMHHFNFNEALFYNYGVVLCYPILIFVWFKWVLSNCKAINKTA